MVRSTRISAVFQIQKNPSSTTGEYLVFKYYTTAWLTPSVKIREQRTNLLRGGQWWSHCLPDSQTHRTGLIYCSPPSPQIQRCNLLQGGPALLEKEEITLWFPTYQTGVSLRAHQLLFFSALLIQGIEAVSVVFLKVTLSPTVWRNSHTPQNVPKLDFMSRKKAEVKHQLFTCRYLGEEWQEGIPWWSSGEDLVLSLLGPGFNPWLGN